MKNKLPAVFLERMKDLMGREEADDFLASYREPAWEGLRINRLKISREEFLKISPFSLEEVPWSDDGFYYTGERKAGKHPFYHCGLYYIQEPSAMLPAMVLGAKPGERVLDLCAAPGGKTVKIAADMENTGLLAVNDISPKRIKALIKNIELMGVKNTIVFNETPERLAERYGEFFDRILVDAPCSGQGMFRKDSSSISALSRNYGREYSTIQRDLMEQSHKMLRPGGAMVYSTCTFNPDENENVIAGFLNDHKDYILEEIPLRGGMERGRNLWLNREYKGDKRIFNLVEKSVRIWPHKSRGEGHFTALLIKGGRALKERETVLKPGVTVPELDNFLRDNIKANPIDRNRIFTFGSAISCFTSEFPSTFDLKVLKRGWFLGVVTRHGFSPSQAFYMGIACSCFKNMVDLNLQSIEVLKYLKGETLMIKSEKGHVAICVDGHGLGYGKSDGNYIKNCYPAGWRITRE